MAGGDCQPFSNFFWFKKTSHDATGPGCDSPCFRTVAFGAELTTAVCWQWKWGTPETYGKSSKKNALVDQDSYGFIKILVLEYPPTNTPEGNFDTQLYTFVGLQSWNMWNRFLRK